MKIILTAAGYIFCLPFQIPVHRETAMRPSSPTSSFRFRSGQHSVGVDRRYVIILLVHERHRRKPEAKPPDLTFPSARTFCACDSKPELDFLQKHELVEQVSSDRQT
jgi:hypothetical protein